MARRRDERERLKMNVGFEVRMLLARIVAGVLLTWLPSTICAANFVKPGDSGSISWEVKNNAQSGGPMTNVSVTVTAPAHFVQQQSSQLGPVASIPPGGSHIFQLDYAISQNATDGETLDVNLHSTQDTRYATNRTAATSVLFTPFGLRFSLDRLG